MTTLLELITLQGLINGFISSFSFALIVGLIFKLRLYSRLKKMDGNYEGEEVDPESDKDHEMKEYEVKVSLWNILKPNSLLILKQHFIGDPEKSYHDDWESNFYVPEFNFLFLHGYYEYESFDDWGFHNMQLNPNREEIAVEVISKNKEQEGRYLLKKVS